MSPHPRSSLISEHSRWLDLSAAEPNHPRASFAAEVRHGLTKSPKRLPCRFFYDHAGSQLFEQICELPEYYPTRAERSILEKRSDELAEHFDDPPTLVELGSGSAVKTRLLIESFLSHHGRLTFVPIDISHSMLEQSASDLLADYPDLDVRPIAGEYEAGISRLGETAPAPRLVLWLGSSIGNLDRSAAVAFLRRVTAALEANDRILVGIDLRKHPQVLERAYDDSQGVTARFNLNLLRRINRELGADFPVSQFAHKASYLEDEGRVEMHLVSRESCRVRIPAGVPEDANGGADTLLEVAFEPGESIHTENSHKYSHAEIDELAQGAGLEILARWLDVDGLFSLNLFGRSS